MSQFVIGADQVAAISAAIASCIPSVLTIAVDVGGEFAYAQTEKSLTRVVADLETGALASAVIRCSDERIRYALIHSLLFNQAGFTKWMGTIELGVEEWQFVWDALLASPDLLFICVGVEEGVEFLDRQLSPESFPWSEWPLLVGAVRSTKEGDWVIRWGESGPR